MTPISIGEIHVPGSAGLGTTRCLTLTSPSRPDGSFELFFAIFAAEAQKRILERLTDRLAEELRPVFFQKGDPEARFEAALKQANKTILAFLYEHGLSLPGIKLRGATAALSNGKLFVSSRGSMRGLLYLPREGSLAPYALFDEAPEKISEPKFFTSLQAGAFPDGARLVMATSELFRTLDDAHARELLGQSDFAKASRDVKSALRGSEKPISILSLSSPPPTSASAETAAKTNASSKVVRTTATPTRATAPIITSDVGDMIARGLRSGLAAVGRAFIFLGSLVWRLLKSLVRLPLKIPGFVAMLANRERRGRYVADCISAPDRWLSSTVGRLNALSAPSRTRFFVLLGLGAVFAHGILFSIRHEAHAQIVKAYAAQLAQLQQLEADFAAGMIYDNESRSRELLASMETVWKALPETTASQKKTKTEAEAALVRAREQMRRLIVLEKPMVFATITETNAVPSAMRWFGGKLYVFSSASGRVRVFSEQGAAAADPTITALSAGVASAAAARTGFLLQSASGTLVYWNPATSEEKTYEATDLSGKPMLFYQSRLYAASADGTVTRQTVEANTLGSPADVLRGAPASPADMATDGAVYLLYKDGSTRKYLKGASMQNYAPSPIDPAPAKAGQLWASADSDKLVFIDQGGDRAFTVDKTTGRLLAQLTAPEFKNLRTATVDENGRAVYLLAESGTIYKVPLK